MSDILLSDGSLVGAAFSDAGLVLFGLLIFFFGVVLTLTLLLKMKPELYMVLLGFLKIQILLLLGIVVLDLFGSQGVAAYAPYEDLSAALSTHRWLIIQLPFILLLSAAVTLAVYRERLVEKHARQYYLATIFSIYLSFATILLIGFESMV